ncbi:DUF1127 domain-containing protein [Variovorax sp. J22P240]|uniref:DUF1127 domain-containing protein n=1 Tax=Variovorax sp. J22P240 TaxID=3053514 RepID=UPI002575787D|nr:DUF1127 domain-containing protein [Variovorax sp. J22P240]MDM0002360.1 DUF1127 domain-containing protein [Variovorax sp. J22P240]
MPSSKPALFAAIVETIRNARRVGRDQRLLRAMSERELSDLGVGRSEIPGLLQESTAAGRTQVSDAAAPRSGPRSHARCGADGGPAARP